MKRNMFVKKEKGFTLIEAIGALVILSVMILVATPRILNAIVEARIGVYVGSTYGIAKTAEHFVETNNLYEKDIDMSDNLLPLLNVDQSLMESGEVFLSDEDRVLVAVQYGVWCFIKVTEEVITFYPEEFDECSISMINDMLLPPELIGTSTAWHNTDRTVGIDASNTTPFGVRKVEYRIDGGGWNEYTNELLFSIEKDIEIEARTIDIIGNESDISIGNVRIDKTPPTCEVIGGSEELFYEPRTIVGECSDQGGAGCTGDVSRTFLSNVDSNFSPGSVCDSAGNCTTCSSVLVRVKVEHLITYITNGHGSISPSNLLINHGSDASIPIVTPNEGYIIDSFDIIEGQSNATINSNTGELSNIIEDVTVRANFIPEVEIVTASTTQGTNRTRSKTIALPVGATVISIETDTGNVAYSHNSDTGSLTITGSSGTAVNSYTPSTNAWTTLRRSNTNFPLNTTVTRNGITGSIPRSGSMSSYVISGSAAHSKTHTISGTFRRDGFSRYTNGEWVWSHSVDDGNPMYAYSYGPDSDGYSGTLYSTGPSTQVSGTYVHYGYPSSGYEGEIILHSTQRRTYENTGTISKPDTRVWEYSQYYYGTIYGSTVNEYRYNFTIEYRP